MWLPSISGNSQTDSLIAVASGVCSSHWHQPSSDIGNSSPDSLDGVTVHGWVRFGNMRVEASEQRWDRMNAFQKGLQCAGALSLIVASLSGALWVPGTAGIENAEPARSLEFRLDATIKDIMDSLVDPSADYIWDAVATTVTAKGKEEKYPRTDEEWKELRRRAIQLMEASNLLLIPGRRVARPG